MKALLLAAAALLAACVDPPPQIRAVERAPAAPTAAAPAATPPIADAAAPTPDPWQRVAGQLEIENRQLTAERDYWKGEAARYHNGYERAVAELNRVVGAARAAQYAAELRAVTAPPASPRVWAGTPRVQVLGYDALVTGTLYSYDDADVRGELSIELLVDGRVKQTKAQPFDVPARTSVSFSERFMLAGAGAYSARLRINPR